MEQVYTEIENLLEGLDSEFNLKKVGKAFSEIRHVDVNKGNFVAKLLQSGQVNGGIALGDTDADEGMFQAMNQMGDPRFISVIVSNNHQQQTSAQYRLNSVDEVHTLLNKLNSDPDEGIIFFLAKFK